MCIFVSFLCALLLVSCVYFCSFLVRIVVVVLCVLVLVALCVLVLVVLCVLLLVVLCVLL